MKILLLTNMYPTEPNSFYGIFVKEYVETMRKLGLEIDVFFTDGRTNRLRYLEDLPRLRKMMLEKPYDILHAQHTYSVYQMAVCGIFRQKKIPSVLTLHEGEVMIPSGSTDGSADFIGKLIYSKLAKRIAMDLVDEVISVESTMPRVIGYKRPFSIIPPGVDIGLFLPLDRKDCRSRLNIPLDRPMVFFPADPQRSINKGFSLLEKALENISEDINLVCGGKIPHDDMVFYMNAADVVVQTSNFEASPMVIKEAMACNTPVVTTDVGDVRWILGNTPGCYICQHEPSDLVRQLRAALGFNRKTDGRERIILLGLSQDGIARKNLEIYEAILAKRPIPRMANPDDV